MFAAVPLLVLPVAIYNLVLLILPGGPAAAGASAELASPLFTVPMTSGAAWPVCLGDVLLASALAVLFVDLMKPSGGPRAAAANLGFCLLLLVLCVGEFLALGGCATSVFFLITLMVLLDALAAFTVTVLGGRSRPEA